ncbi:GspE/PulE family protein [Bowmanella dokdonensis]|uniref:Type II/IV secretion system protein n=1 Tax=Bowmanella dokdonensis TaxID=751969 RepID=A0A939IR26_9ALTE|nr:GspE/PulE family protein [Bowmanella dokdonensis]MBN7827535.1 type II/IV secretion system protein [Bowmanella dokdonensis]
MKVADKVLTDDFGVSKLDLEKARQFQRKNGGRVEQLLINLGSLPEDKLHEYYSTVYEVPQFDSNLYTPSSTTLDPELLNRLIEFDWFPVSDQQGHLSFAVRYPLQPEAHDYLHGSGIASFITQVASSSDLNELRAWFASHLAQDDEKLQLGGEDEEERLKEMASEAPTVNLLNALVTRALRQNASDMHLEPIRGQYRVRFRIDGVLHDIETLPARMQLPIATRLKILSGMDIAEKRRPQDGKIEMKIANQELDIRVSALPLNEGESIVMRFLRKESINYDMSVLGVAADIVEQIEADLNKTAGVVLMTGPTGSGKTTTLYTFLNHLNDDDVKIITLEDPVEYQLSGVNQVQVNPDIDLTFAAGLRSIVRQDPDVIMVGEIRDKETAQIALQSALTGHLVFSTVHTNDAPSAYTRLMDLGVEEFLLNAGLVSILAQRLVRKLCEHCCVEDQQASIHMEQYQLASLAAQFAIDIPRLKMHVGCDKCSGTGYKGRVAIIEYLPCDEVIKSIPKDANFIGKARQYQKQQGRRSLLEDGFVKALHGTTTIEEVLRVAG